MYAECAKYTHCWRREKKLILLGIHTEINQRVESRIRHGQPEEREEDVLGVAVAHHVLGREEEGNGINQL